MRKGCRKLLGDREGAETGEGKDEKKWAERKNHGTPKKWNIWAKLRARGDNKTTKETIV